MGDLRELSANLTESSAWIDSVSNDLAEAIFGEIPQLGDEPEIRRATLASNESNVRLFLEIVRTGGDPARAEPPPAAVEYARQFVRRGVTIETLMRVYHVGLAAFLRRWSAAVREYVADEAERTDAVERGAALGFEYVNTLTRDLVERYAEERDRWVRSAAAVRTEVVQALLAGDSIDTEHASSQLRYPLDRHHIAFLIWSGESTSETETTALGSLERTAAEMAAKLSEAPPLLLPLGSGTVAGWIGGYEPLDSSRLSGLRLPAGFPDGARMAIGTRGDGPSGFASSHREARQARRVAELSEARPGGVTAYDNVSLAALASADLDHARAFVDRELGPLAGDDDDSLRIAGTLRVYLEERSSPTRTAERLGVHANTIANRVRTAEELLGHPIETRVSELLVALRLAPLVRTG